MWTWYYDVRSLDAPPWWIWALLLKEVLFILLVFKVKSGNWLGRKKK